MAMVLMRLGMVAMEAMDLLGLAILAMVLVMVAMGARVLVMMMGAQMMEEATGRGPEDGREDFS